MFSVVFLWVKRKCQEVTVSGPAGGLVNWPLVWELSVYSDFRRNEREQTVSWKTEFIEFSLGGRLMELFYSHLGMCKARFRV